MADFGLARTLGGDDLTSTGDRVGTLRYMSPEQITGDRIVDQRTDIYSLGLTLYEMLACTPAFAENDRHALAQQIVDGRIQPLTKLDRAVPRDLETIIHNATARDADARYISATELADDLRRYLEQRPIKARRASRTHRLWQWSRRNGMVAGLSATVLLLLTVVSIAGIAGSVHLAYVADETQLKLYASDMHRADELLRAGDTFQAIKTLQRHAQETGGEDQRHFEWYYLRSRCDQLSPKWTFGHPVSAYDATFSPDSKLLATCAWSPQVYLWDVATGRRRHELIGHRKWTSRDLFSYDGNTLISGNRDGTIRFWDVQSGEQIGVIGDADRADFAIHDMALSSDGRLIAAVCHDPREAFFEESGVRSVVVWDFATIQRVAQLDGLGTGVSSLRFSPDGVFLMSGNDDGMILVWDCESWKLVRSVDAHTSDVNALAISPDGSMFASASFVRHAGFTRSEVKLWDLTQWRLIRTIQHHNGRVTEIDYSRDSRWLLLACNDNNVSVWSTEDGRCVKDFRPHAARVLAARMSPDGEYLATAAVDNFVKVWNVSDLIRPSKTQTFYRPSNYVHSLALADNGKSVITGDVSGEVSKRDASNGEILYQFQVAPPTGWRIEVAVSRDNQWLAVATGRKNQTEDSGEIEIRHVATGELLRRFPTPVSYMHGLQFSPNGERLAFGGVRAAYVVDRRTGNVVQDLVLFEYVKQVKWSPSGKQLAVAEKTGWTSVFDTSDYRRLTKLQTDDGWGTIGFDYSPDGSEFATSGGDKKVKIWDARTFQRLDTFDECPDWIGTVSYSADGRRLLTTGKDGVLRVWRRELGESLLTLDTGPLWTMNGQFSPNGMMVASATDVIRIWRCKDHFKPVVIHLPPNQPCHEAMELHSTYVANSDAGAANVD